ncbi:DUF3784 domain-containing protein [Halobacterium bonnevillei]|uniref:DUF3784 domain-containing protein n=1 Tax=Halobacterium bonnevillei TaxID=2692200 RepID=A0A6B0SJ53_9EURY|nr:DUF3784 domain-containing protein [Halobacterium bonnevillei]MXR21834.1 DUF3784 domain-containing protein [Halobacterium bonnevillei]
MIDVLTAGAEWFLIGALFVVIAYLIKVRRWAFLIAGYDETAAIPEDVAVSVVGNFLLRVGIAAGVLGVLETTDAVRNIGLVFGAAVTLDLLRVLYRLNTYEPPENTSQ